MKTYTKQKKEVKNRLVIEADEFSESPREWSNLGYFITSLRNYNSPDKNEEIESILKETGENANSPEEHEKELKKELKKAGYKIKYLTLVSKYEHGSVSYSRGVSRGFDSGVCGVYFVEVNEETSKMSKKQIESIIDSELETYTNYCNGEVYQFTLFDENGEQVDACSGFYDIKSIKDRLPEEWKDENLEKYLV